MTWTISPDMGSFRFLKRYNDFFKKSIEHYHSTNGLRDYYKLPTTFCAYYIKVIWTIAYMSLIAWSVLSIPLASWMWWAGLIVNSNGVCSPIGFLFLPAYFVMCIAVATLIVSAGYFLISLLRKVFHKFSSEPKPSVVKTWMKARKNKYCPLIEYKL